MAAIDLSIVSTVGLACVAAYAGLLRYTLKREREVLEAKITTESDASKSAHNANVAARMTLESDYRAAHAKLEAQHSAALARIVDNEKAIIRQDGLIALLRQALDTAHATLEEIKRQQVPRAEWERQMRNVETTLATILERIDSEWKPKSA